MRDPAVRRIVLLSLALLLLRIASTLFVAQPGYTDAYYYLNVASRLAHGEGLSADFVWSWVEAPHLEPLPIASHRFWMPLASVIQGAGIAALGPVAGELRAAQLAIVAIAALLPVVSWRAARAIGGDERTALVAAALTGLGGILAPAWVTLDGFAAAAVLGTLFFLAFARAAAGSVPAGCAAGALVGALFLARAEGFLFGLALLALAIRPATFRAGALGSAVALVIGGAWLARDLAVGGAADVLARSAQPLAYEQFFALVPSAGGSLGEALAAKAGALGADALTALSVFGVVLLPLAIVGARGAWERPAVRAWAGLALLLYLTESLVWTLHATRGSYAHSLAAFFPFGVALAGRGAASLLARRPAPTVRLVAVAGIAAFAVISAAAVVEWGAVFDPPLHAREAARDAIPAGPFLAADAAAWRWIAGRPVLVTPADGVGAAGCAARAYGARSLVLEAVPRFTAYDALYRGDDGATPSWLGAPIARGSVRVFPIIGVPVCDR